MSKNEIITLINNRIHELKFQQVHLRTFIHSDQERYDQIEFAINELRQLLKDSADARQNKRGQVGLSNFYPSSTLRASSKDRGICLGKTPAYCRQRFHQ